MKSKKNLLLLWICNDLLTIDFENMLSYCKNLPGTSIIILNPISITSILYLVNRKYKVVQIIDL